MENEKKSNGIKGGKRPGAGRKPGVPNKATQETREAIKASGLTPLEFMLDVMRNDAEDLPRRLMAANMAAPYVHAKLSSVEVSGKDGEPLLSGITVTLVKPDEAA